MVPTEHTNNAVSAYNTVLSNQIGPDAHTDEIELEAFKMVEEDVLGIYWIAPPPTALNKLLDDEAWNVLVGWTEALEKAPKDIVEAEKKY
eukprot:15121605-Ditylum_brightwellii.AAC.1